MCPSEFGGHVPGTPVAAPHPGAARGSDDAETSGRCGGASDRGAASDRPGGGHGGRLVECPPAGCQAAEREEARLTAPHMGLCEEPVAVPLEVSVTRSAEVGPDVSVLGEASPALWDAARSGQPVVLTRDGAAALVVLDLDSYREVELPWTRRCDRGGA
jgi:hypothetical protein